MTLENESVTPGLSRLQTGVPGFDDVLRGGLPANYLYLIEGDTGSGKTTLGLQFLREGRRRDERVLWCTLSESEEQLHEIARSHGWSLSGIEIVNLSKVDGGNYPQPEYSFFSPADVELGDVTKSLMEVVQRVRPTRLVFDPFSDVLLLARDPLRYRRQILALREFFRGRGCTGLLLQELVRNGMPPDDSTVGTVVHGIITLDQLTPAYGEPRRRLHVRKMRASSYCGGYHDFSIETGGLVVYPRMAASGHISVMSDEVASSGVTQLDEMLGGGVHRGTSLLVMGPSGSGKSSLSTQYALAALDRGEHAAVYLFAETARSFLARSDGLGNGFREHTEKGRAMLRQVEPGEMSAGAFANSLRRTVEAEQTRVVVVDGLTGYLQAMYEESRLGMHLQELLTFLGDRDVVTVLTVNEYGLMGERVSPAFNVSHLMGTVLLLRYFESAGTLRRSIAVLKRRTGAHDVLIRELLIRPPGIEIGGSLAEFRGVLTGHPWLSGESNGAKPPIGGSRG